MQKAEGVVLCGGLGSRLRPLTYYFQKTMLPVGKEQRPILEYILRLLRHNGIQKAVLLANYKFEQIQNYFGDGGKLGMKLLYVMDDPALEGSGWAILNALRRGSFSGDATLLVYYGDILTTMDIGRLLERHESSGAAATLAVSEEYRLSVGVAHMKGSRIVRFEEKPTMRINVGTGIMALRPSALKVLEEMSNKKKRLDLMGDLLPELLKRGERVDGFAFDDFWMDVGSIEAYEKMDHSGLDEAFAHLLRAPVTKA